MVKICNRTKTQNTNGIKPKGFDTMYSVEFYISNKLILGTYNYNKTQFMYCPQAEYMDSK